MGWDLEGESILPLFSGRSHSVDNICLQEELVMTFFEIFAMLDLILMNTDLSPSWTRHLRFRYAQNSTNLFLQDTVGTRQDILLELMLQTYF